MAEQKNSGHKHAPDKGKGKPDDPKNMTPQERDGQNMEREVGQYSGEGTPPLQKK